MARLAKKILVEFYNLFEDLETPTFALGIGSTFEEKNRGFNEGHAFAAKKFKKLMKKYGLEIKDESN